MVSGRPTPGLGSLAVENLSITTGPPTAHVCANESATLGALSGFARRGLAHGRDAVINATDDLNVSAYFVPPLTTSFLPIGRLARLLGEFMLARLDGQPIESLQRLLMPDLIERSDDVLASDVREKVNG